MLSEEGAQNHSAFMEVDPKAKSATQDTELLEISHDEQKASDSCEKNKSSACVKSDDKVEQQPTQDTKPKSESNPKVEEIQQEEPVLNKHYYETTRVRNMYLQSE